MSPSVEVASSPAQSGRSRKRVRVGGGATAEYDALQRLRDGEACADALGTPAVSLALHEFLSSLRPHDDERIAAEEALRALHGALTTDGIADGQAITADDPDVHRELKEVSEGHFCKSTPSFFMSRNRKEICLTMKAPSEVAVVGSFLLGFATRPLVIDVGLTLPSQIFKSKDFLNYRYHDKRLLYLTLVVHNLRKDFSNIFTDFAIGRHVLAEDHEKPLASFSPVAMPSITIRLVPLIVSDLFDWSKLSENRGNIRPSGASSIKEKPTPEYNAGILVDSVIMRHLKSLHRYVKSVPAFLDATLMLRSWVTRRRLCHGSGFVSAALLAHTIALGSVPKHASKEHLFRAVLTVVISGGVEKLTMNGAPVTIRWDDGRRLRWREEAKAALLSLDAPGSEIDAWGGVLPFLFCTARGSISESVPLCTLFDGFITVGSSLEAGFEFGLAHNDLLLSQENVRRVIVSALIETKRVLRVEQIDHNLFGMTFYHPGMEQDPFRKVEVRPKYVSADKFREFWGPKVEMRRFKDGRIIESIIWKGGPAVLNEILQYSFKRHFGDKLSVTVALAQIDDSAGLTGIDHGSARASAVFNELSTLLRKAKGLPLAISAVQGASPHLRRCGVMPVRPNQKGKFVEPLEIVASFESSGAWPDDVMALASAKAAFYVALKSGLAAIGITSQPTVSFIDILMGGFVFRLRIRVDKEKSLPGLADSAKENLIWETETRLKLHDDIRNVRSPVLGDTVRVFKRWLSSHFLLCEVGDRSDAFIELFVRRVFTVSHEIVPRSAFSGFCRCLHLLAEFPWEAAPLVITSYGLEKDDMDRDDDAQSFRDDVKALYAEAFGRFESCIESSRSFPWFATRYDPGGDNFKGRHGPEKVIWKRARSVACASLQLIDTLQCRSEADDSKWNALFSTPRSAFHHAIILDRMYVPRKVPLSKGPLCSRAPVTRLDSSLVGFDPVVPFVQGLKAELGRFALFLYDTYGGSCIFVVWRPNVEHCVPFSLRALPFMRPLGDSTEVEANKLEMLACIRRIGGSLIRSVEAIAP